MTIAWKAPAAAVFCTFALLGCQANSGPVGGGGGGGLDPDTGIDADGNPTGDGSNTDTGFPNDGSVGGSILDEGVELIGADTGQGFICTQAASADAGAEIEVAANGLVGSVLGPLLDLLSADSVNALLNSVRDRNLALDQDFKTAAAVTQTAAGLLGQLNSLDIVVNLPQTVGSGRYAVFALSFPPSLLDLGLLSSVSVTTLLNDTEVETGATVDATGLSLLGFSTDQLGSVYALVGYKASEPFDAARLSISSDFLSVDLGENLFIHELCTGGRLVDAPAS